MLSLGNDNDAANLQLLLDLGLGYNEFLKDMKWLNS